MNKEADFHVITFIPEKTMLLREGEALKYIDPTPEEVSDAILCAIRKILDKGCDVSRMRVEIKRNMIWSSCSTTITVIAPIASFPTNDNIVQTPETRR